MDSTDRKILAILQDDASMSVADIAKRVNLSQTPCWRRIQKLQDADVPGEVVVPHVMRQVTEADCNPDRVNEVVSGTSLVPDNVLAAMFGG